MPDDQAVRHGEVQSEARRVASTRPFDRVGDRAHHDGVRPVDQNLVDLHGGALWIVVRGDGAIVIGNLGTGRPGPDPGNVGRVFVRRPIELPVDVFGVRFRDPLRIASANPPSSSKS